jgi:hypothetical protein
VPHSQEKTPEQTTELPNPELNPLLNPTLGRHLGRWAQVYFTSPPEKREEAVEELLRELKGVPASESEESEGLSDHAPIAERTVAQPTLGETIRIVEAVADTHAEQQCSRCGHSFTSPQRFCGLCGAMLEADRETSSELLAQPHATPEPAFHRGTLPSLTPMQPSADPADDGYSDILWLREKSFSGENSSWGRVRYAPAIIAVLAIGILFYAQSRPQKASGPTVTAQPLKAVSPPEATSVPEKSPVEKPAESASASKPEPAADPPKTASRAPTVAPPAAKPHAVETHAASGQNVPASSAATEVGAALNPANGAIELATAEDFLNGRRHPRSSEEAAKYLWRAVGKENPTAILLLSDLYLAGDGVPKSCDQARLLLSAAAKKGVPQAAEKLSNLLRSGCPK